MIGLRRISVAARIALLAGLIAASAGAQVSRAVNPSQTYQRLLMIVPITGSGTHMDPRRPLYTPAPQDIKNGEGIIAFASLDSDDKKWALVELVALNLVVAGVQMGIGLSSTVNSAVSGDAPGAVNSIFGFQLSAMAPAAQWTGVGAKAGPFLGALVSAAGGVNDAWHIYQDSNHAWRGTHE